MSKRISAKAVRMVLRGPAHLTEEYASDLVAQMVQVDRNLAALREDKRKHGRTLNVSARARARVASKEAVSASLGTTRMSSVASLAFGFRANPQSENKK
jgi:hypothetical protein